MPEARAPRVFMLHGHMIMALARNVPLAGGAAKSLSLCSVTLRPGGGACPRNVSRSNRPLGNTTPVSSRMTKWADALTMRCRSTSSRSSSRNKARAMTVPLAPVTPTSNRGTRGGALCGNCSLTSRPSTPHRWPSPVATAPVATPAARHWRRRSARAAGHCGFRQTNHRCPPPSPPGTTA